MMAGCGERPVRPVDTLEDAVARAKAGMKLAADHADAVIPDWQDRAFDVFQKFARTRPEFLTEDVRVFAVEQGLPIPPDNRAWGAVTRRAVREELIEFDRYAKKKVRPSNACPMPVWRSLIH